MTGPLNGLRVLELAGIGPGPHAAMILGDLGAEVIRVERPSDGLKILPDDAPDWLLRGRLSVAADLKTSGDLAAVMKLMDKSDVLIEGFRPGVTERLGIGPDECLTRNPRLVYARMTGWGQTGPLSQHAGHDINYIALTGILNAIRSEGGKPVPPLNLVGDFGGGSLYLVVGILAALRERDRSGAGQVIDAAIVDGTCSLAQMIWSFRAQGVWSDQPSSNLLDSGAPFYDTYQCADGRYVAVGALEPQFYAQLLAGLGLNGHDLPQQMDQQSWPILREYFAKTFATRARDEWEEIFNGTDACVTPVLSFSEASSHPHLIARATLIDMNGVVQAAPTPRFSRTPTKTPVAPPPLGRDTEYLINEV
ncbi:CaiB/BaiF CoA-transferase family protein [Streptomyces sp. NBC_01643]|uniref:CaiB/BaiF CoA transferase family protein n=1 Tax=Streptomyces sp. NBC_01643 TaxID=2975906 RepID=UPI002F90B773|nr:CoA transferase [Streptomyces sp. NBC_01643]